MSKSEKKKLPPFTKQVGLGCGILAGLFIIVVIVIAAIFGSGDPRFDKVKSPTNQSSATLSASNAYKNAKIDFYQEGNKTQELKSDGNGKFSVKVDLKEGDNKFKATATNEKGKSKTGKEINIVYDKTPPDFSFDQPQSPTESDKFTLKGKSEKNAEIIIYSGDKELKKTKVKRDSFEIKDITLNEGENKYTIRAIDEADNYSEPKETVVFYQKPKPTEEAKKTESSKKYEKLTLNAQKDGENIKVEGETDLPNDSKLTIEVARPTTLAGESDKGYSKVGWGTPLVKDGKYSAEIKVDDISTTDYVISIEPRCRITVSFYPNWYGDKIQNDEVLELVGSKGENLAGDLIKTIGSATKNPYQILETTATIDFPLRAQTDTSSSSTDKVTYSNISISKSSGTIRVLGEITNNTNSNIPILWITVSFYDSNGRLLDTATDTQANLGPHATKTFEAMGLDPGNYKDYKVQIDM